MNEPTQQRAEPRHDRALLLYGPKRNEVLTLREVQQYGIDSFSDADYIHLYGMPPTEWYSRGIRLLGRTAVECTRDALGDLIGRDVAEIAAKLPSLTSFVVIDPFAGSCNTLYWILKHQGMGTPVAEQLRNFRLGSLAREFFSHVQPRLDRRPYCKGTTSEPRRPIAGVSPPPRSSILLSSLRARATRLLIVPMGQLQIVAASP
jgi:hypothetical protein